MCRHCQRSMPTALMSAMIVLGGSSAALADESGVSFWLLGTYATQAAIPADPGLSIDMTYYSAGASAGPPQDPPAPPRTAPPARRASRAAAASRSGWTRPRTTSC